MGRTNEQLSTMVKTTGCASQSRLKSGIKRQFQEQNPVWTLPANTNESRASVLSLRPPLMSSMNDQTSTMEETTGCADKAMSRAGTQDNFKSKDKNGEGAPCNTIPQEVDLVRAKRVSPPQIPSQMAVESRASALSKPTPLREAINSLRKLCLHNGRKLQNCISYAEQTRVRSRNKWQFENSKEVSTDCGNRP